MRDEEWRTADLRPSTALMRVGPCVAVLCQEDIATEGHRLLEEAMGQEEGTSTS